ncbi:MAG: hypothetical protein EBS01_03035 [Verrucomicrobia bacterium]|nr:hypothetical protein [Verrucomicrobiota bacterium]
MKALRSLFRNLAAFLLAAGTTFSVDGAAEAGPTKKLTVAEAASETRALLQGRKISDILGVTHVSGQYALTEKPFLIEGAEAVQILGARILKIWFYASYEKQYFWHSNWPKDVPDLEALGKTPYYEAVFAMPFHTFVLETAEFGMRKNFWQKGLSDTDKQKVHDQIYRLTKHLLTRYRSTGKTFVLQNWEADNVMKFALKDTSPDTWDTAYQGMCDWINARQTAVEQARRDCGTDGVQVLHAFEVNFVPSMQDLAAGKLYEKGKPLVVDKVVPKTRCDLYSLSSWETWAPGKEDSLLGRLNYLASKAPHDGILGESNLMLGEFGAQEDGYEKIQKNYPVYKGDTSGAAFYALHRMVDAALRAGVRYMIHWEIYDNDLRMGGKYEGKGLPPGVMATAEQCVGNWLIRPDGSRVPTYDYFKALFDAELAEAQR